MKNISITQLRAKKNILLQKIITFNGKILRGSVIERYKRCGKAGCKCQKGKGHGPKYYLSVSIAQQYPKQIYVPQKDINKVKEYVANYKKMQQLLEEISNINREILSRKEKLED